jgi:hypothetical protein
MKSHLYGFASGVLAILLCSGCAHYSVDLNLTEGNFRSKGKTIAVISGTKEQQNVELAKLIGDSLRKNSRYQVVSPAQVSQSLDLYPQTIKGPYKSAYFFIDTDWALGDRKKISDIQSRLGVDYLFVIWAPIAVQQRGSDISSVPSVAQLFERPNTKEVAEMTLIVTVGDDGNLYLKEGIDEAARQLAEKTNMAIAAKK